ncbi:hypothetical protein HMPREF1634_01735 [Tissierellia bacterium S7-1-4]|nr:hypothetical protein HMPREF1634_01735 [Tissierellia bacterium S7-1-4]
MKIKFKMPHEAKKVEVEYKNGESIVEIIKREFKNYKRFLGAVVNAELKSLYYKPKADDEIVLLDIENSLGLRIYTTSLSMIYAYAIKSLYPNMNTVIEHYVGSTIYTQKIGEEPFTIEEVKSIEKRMREIVKENIDIKMEKWNSEKAIDYYSKIKRDDVVKLLETSKAMDVNMYRMDNFLEKFEGVLVPSSEFIEKFELSYYYPGLLIRFPSSDKNFEIDINEEEAKLAKTFQDHTKDAHIIGVNYVGELNDKILSGKSRDLILVSESFLDMRIRDIAIKIAEDSAKRVVLISGPSSSGKTTFAQKLKIALTMYGLNSIEISTDDYFVDRKMTPKNPDGTYDFETIDAVDIESLNRDIIKLIESGETEKRSFDFIEGKPIFTGEKHELGSSGIIIIEGIHALNPILSKDVPNRNKLKLYLSALTTMNIDSMNRLSTTDVRFLRRMVRDVRTRGRDVSTSLNEWENVRKGEDKYVFPFQEEADIMINTSLFYEIAVLKKHAMALLEKVPESDRNYVRANRLMDMLRYFVSIEDDAMIPNTSLIREFIGGSIFE